MIERVHTYADPIEWIDGELYTIHVLGRRRSDGSWEGSLLFEPHDGSAPVETERETTQPHLEALSYWASGLEPAYMEGALRRARKLRDPHHDHGQADSDESATSDVELQKAAAAGRPRAVLNPFEVYPQGEHVLREELGALSEDHLHAIQLAYSLVPHGEARGPDRAALIDSIVEGVRERMSRS